MFHIGWDMTSISPHEPTIVESFGGWDLVEGLHGRSLRRRSRRGLRPHLVLGLAATAAGAWFWLRGALDDRAAVVVVGFGVLVLLFGSRAGERGRRELRFGETELGWAVAGEPSGTRWPHSEIACVEFAEPLKDLPPGMARRVRPRYKVAVRTKSGDDLPFAFVTTDEQSARTLAARIADEARLDLKFA